MRYLALIYIEADKLDAAPAAECLAYAAELREEGRCTAAEALRTGGGIAGLELRDGRPVVTDGPFPETKELLAGFYVLDTVDLDEAVELASRIPPLEVGRVELRPILEA